MPAKKKTTTNPRAKKELAVPIVPEKTLEELRSEDAEVRASALTDILGNTLPEIPHSFRYRLDDAERIRNAFDFTFMLIGGQPAFALWAAQNPTEFYKLHAKMIPATNNVLQTSGNIIFNTGAETGGLNKPIQINQSNIIDNDEDED